MRDRLLATFGRTRGNAFVQDVFAELDRANHEQRHQEPLFGGPQQDGISSVISENSADTDPKEMRRLKKLAEKSDNATYNAMNSKLRLLAYELHAGGKELGWTLDMAKANKKPDKAWIDGADARLSQTIGRLGDMARETDAQLRLLNTPEGDPRLKDGAQALVAALDELQPLQAEVEAWMSGHKLELPAWEVVGRSNSILKLIFPGLGIGRVAKPLTSVEKTSGMLKNTSIDAHLDAAIVAAESLIAGNRQHYDRLIVHAKEVPGLLNNQVRFGPTDPRIMQLLSLVDQLLVKEPWMKPRLDVELGPLRDVK